MKHVPVLLCTVMLCSMAMESADVFTISGKRVCSFIAGANTQVPKLSKGVYIVKIRNSPANRQIMQRRFVQQ
jgi:hypothetical protein